MNKRLIAIFGGATLLLAAFLGFLIFNAKEPITGKTVEDTRHWAGDVIGTRNVTSTVGVCFACTNGGLSATSSYVSRIGGLKQVAVYTIKNLSASSTSQAQFDVQGSNDDQCDTTVASGGNEPVTGDINWFSAGEHFANKVHASVWNNVSSTAMVSWANPMDGAGQEIVLTNLNYECLRLNVRASSTILWAQLRTR